MMSGDVFDLKILDLKVYGHVERELIANLLSVREGII